MVLESHPEPLWEADDGLLELGIVEGYEAPAVLAHQVMMVLALGLRALKARQPLPDHDPLDQSVLDEQLERPVDARTAGGRALDPQGVLDLDRAERARLVGQQVDDPLARATVPEAGPAQNFIHVLGPYDR